MEYRVIVGSGPDAFEAANALNRKMEEALKDGWKPVGGVFAMPRTDREPNFHLFQATARE